MSHSRRLNSVSVSMPTGKRSMSLDSPTHARQYRHSLSTLRTIRWDGKPVTESSSSVNGWITTWLSPFNIRWFSGHSKPLEKSRGFLFVFMVLISIHHPTCVISHTCQEGREVKRPKYLKTSKKSRTNPLTLWQVWFMLHASQLSVLPFSWVLPRVIHHLGKATPAFL